jgi:FMN-dependent NADH-azoreductase
MMLKRHPHFYGGFVRTLLQIDSSPMGATSISRKLTAEFARTWEESHPQGKVISRDLTSLAIPIVNGQWVAAAYTPESARSTEQNSTLHLSNSFIADLQEADEYVIGVPMHNFGVPSALKLWIDQVVRAGKTFSYTPDGPIGLLAGKKATLLIATGGNYAPGSPLSDLDFVTPYLRTVFAFMGIKDSTIITAGGTAQLASEKIDSQEFLAPSFDKVHLQASL